MRNRSRLPSSVRKHRCVDPTVYPAVDLVGDKAGEDILQRWIVEKLRPLVEEYLASTGVRAFTGANQFVYFRLHDVRGRVAPDVFVLPGVRPDRRIETWKTWEERTVPSLAIEIASTDFEKDYIDAPPLYRELGVDELVVFDPGYRSEPGRLRFQV